MRVSESISIECHEAVLIARRGDIGRSLGMARDAYQHARADGSESDLLFALNSTALCQATAGAYIEAMATAIDAHRLAVRLGDRSGALQALITVAASSAFILETSEFLPGILDRGLAAAQALGDATLELQVRNARGVILLKLRQYDASIAEFSLAGDLIPGSDGSMPVAIIAANIAAARMRKAGAAANAARIALQDEAEVSIAVALDVATRDANREALSRVHYSLAGLLQQRGEHARALLALDKSLALAELLKHRYRKIAILIERGRILSEIQRYDDAVEAFEAACAEAEAFRPCKELQIAGDRLADAYEMLGDHRAANHARACAERERDEYSRECRAARRELAEFWKQAEAANQSAASRDTATVA